MQRPVLRSGVRSTRMHRRGEGDECLAHAHQEGTCLCVLGTSRVVPEMRAGDILTTMSTKVSSMSRKKKNPYERSPIFRSRIHTRNIKTHTYIRTRSVLAPFEAVPMVSLLPNEVIAMQPLHLHSGPNVQRRCCGESRIGRYLDAVGEIVRRRDRSQEVVDDFE